MRLAVGSSAVPLEAFFDFDDFPFASSAPFSFSGPSSRIHSSNAITPRKFLSSGFFVYASCRPETKSVNCKTNPYRLTWTKLKSLILPTDHWYLSLYQKLTHLCIFIYLFDEYVSFSYLASLFIQDKPALGPVIFIALLQEKAWHAWQKYLVRI